jgi:hypothetical protein
MQQHWNSVSVAYRFKDMDDLVEPDQGVMTRLQSPQHCVIAFALSVLGKL